MTASKLTFYHLHGLSLSLFISAFFALIWGLNGSFALSGSWRWPAAAIVTVLTLAQIALAVSFRRSAKRVAGASSTPPMNPFNTRSYRLAVIAEIIAIPIAGRLLTQSGHGDAIMPVVSIIVGLHFFGLLPAFRSRVFAWVGVGFCAIGLLALALPVHLAPAGGAEVSLRVAVVGLGCAAVLWLSSVPIVLQTLEQLRRQAAD